MKKNNLTIKTLAYLSIFISFILLILWFVQIQFLQLFYERNVIDNIKIAAKNIKDNQDNLDETLKEYAYRNNMCINHINMLTETNYNYKKNNCLLAINNYEVAMYKKDLINSQEDYIILSAPKTNIKSIIYKIELGTDDIVLLNATLQDMNSATATLKRQLIYLILLLIIASIILAVFVSRRLNRPILKIINTAKEMGKGNYNVKFEKSNIKELDELSDVLTVAASEMNKTEELRRDLIANVSHDLKTPLTMIKAYAEKVKDFSYKDDKMREKDLSIIIEETDRLNNLVNDLLDLSKIESGATTLNITKFDLIETLNAILKRYDIVIEKEGIKFALDVPKKVIINADKEKTEQVLYNLINNAIEHCGDDLTVGIKIKSEKDDVLVAITNTGEGLTEEETKLVWNRYYKKEKKHKRNVIGSGIGLSIVKEILECHGFEYGIDSKVNEYTTFYFKIKK